MGEPPLVLPLADPAAEPDLVGGKGASLARLVRAGLPVPDGFHVTTHAYRLADEGREMPPEVEAAILAALPEGPLAVRSSATAEDLPDLSFAGQHDTFLDVRGPDVVDAVRRCWASLRTDRAVRYRARNGITETAMAVVVQRLVPADAAGVLFTANPVTGARDETVVNAAPGLGEALVGGEVTPESHVVRQGVVRSTGDLLDEAQVLELARLGARIQRLHGGPVDVEWARHDGRFAILQARPVTALPEVWNDSLRGDYLWTCANLGEAVPSVMTPATWSIAQALGQPPIAGHPTTGNIGGRFYLNISAALAVGTALGLGRLMRRLAEHVFGRLPEGVEVPRLPLSRVATLRAAVAAIGPFLKENRDHKRRIGGLLAAAPARAEDLRARIAATATAADLRALWTSDVRRLLHDEIRVYDAGARIGLGANAKLRRTLDRLVGERDATALLTGAHGTSGELASLGPLLALSRLRRGELDRESYLRDWGHRFADEFEVSVPRPAEDPTWLDRRLADTGPDPHDLLAGQAAAREGAWRRLVAGHPARAAALRRRLAALAESTRARERARSEMVRGFAVLRAFLVRASELTGHDAFFLALPETLAVLAGDPAPATAIPARRAAHHRYRALPRYPTVILGRFDPESWAADPDRRTDVHAPSAAPAGDGVSGFPGSAGVAEGVARVLATVDDGDALRPGEILVTTVTNIGWTPLFPRVAAVVTDIGAPLSHAAIVARELGIPAVVGCGNATTRIRTGDRIRVDGTRGTVTTLP
ncbi:PEP/pyruvate-binding domain-containing protein [Actinosynnema sp. NPDC047251]|uniref:Pyruvate phosphate dikinase PEP/pyruvate-binding protein n=1 Tax=Saccharothrix espanaensis (strain ATCC 51144 / DSM 44229 / JCM 9112 / NBRC 15066 / NRRL 15764) TaxID=1179773 RepID=K0JUD4_SACES|nr:PEP/pyruvate-binding domain-containing protein [Saccharothrix espanaensis]CCH31455.1 Pyruvate phosphate dikinase PEP/pyruvate-binding protein [Saccharothrix espanaensis DSM 44229]